jgi:outer membrane protein assembly factor BamB
MGMGHKLSLVLFVLLLCITGAYLQEWAVSAERPFENTSLPATSNLSSEATSKSSKVLWSAHAGAGRYASPAVASDKVYTAAAQLSCFDAQTGEEKWVYQETFWFFGSTPAVQNNRIYVGSDDKNMYCIDALTGATVWKFPTKGRIRSSPVVDDNVVYFASEDDYLYAVDTTKHESIWRVKLDKPLLRRPAPSVWISSPSVDQDAVYIGSKGGRLYALNKKTGGEIWSFKAGKSIHSKPIVTGNKVLFACCDNYLYCLDKSSGSLLWRYEISDFRHGSPAVSDGVVYLTEGHYLHAIGAETGERIWRTTLLPYNKSFSTPAVTGERIYVCSALELMCLDKSSGQILWSEDVGADVSFCSPIVANGKIYVITSSGRLYCISE